MAWGILVGVVLAAAPAQKASAPKAQPAPAATKASTAPAETKPRTIRIAVLDVQLTGGGDRKTVEGLSALLASEVARRPALTVVAGSDLRALVGFERQKQLLGCTDSSCMTEIAGALGVGYLVSTEASKVGNTWLLSLALLDAGKAVAVKRVTRRAYSDDSLVDETVKAVDELLAALPGAGPAVGQPVSSLPRGAVEAPGPGGNPPGWHEHDGFFFSGQLGAGVLRTTATDFNLSGPAGSLSLAFGGCLVRDLAVYGMFYRDLDTTPNLKTPGIDLTSSNMTHTLDFLGAGATWYFTQSGWYVALAGGISQVRVKIDIGGVINEFSTKWGPSGRVSLGKEWWVSADWGMGAALHFSLSANKDNPGADPTVPVPTLQTGSLMLSFSATYN